MLCGEGRSAAISYFLGFGQRTSDRFVFKTSFVQVLQHVSTMSGRTEFPFAAALGGDAKRSSLLLVDVVIRGWATRLPFHVFQWATGSG